MTLLELLRQELPKRGGWPEGVVYMVQDIDGFIAGYHSKPTPGCYGIWPNDSYIPDSGWWIKPKLADDRATAIVSREQYEAADWDGTGLPPVPGSVMYFNSVRDEGNDQHLVVEMTSQHDEWNEEATSHIGLKVVPKTGSTRARQAIGINLDPASALQLASDLRRMAMDIKRKEKENV